MSWWWPFSSKTESEELQENSISEKIVTPESVKPDDSIIEGILKGDILCNGLIARQWVNWAAEQIGEEPKYFVGHMITVHSMWVLYEGCRRHKEKENESVTNR